MQEPSDHLRGFLLQCRHPPLVIRSHPGASMPSPDGLHQQSAHHTAAAARAMEAAWKPPSVPTASEAARIRPGCYAVLAASHAAGLGRVFHAFPEVVFGARPTAPCCEIRFLVLHTYPDGIKAYGHERITTPIGRRGKPVKKLRLIPAEDAHAMARSFQGTKGTTISVI